MGSPPSGFGLWGSMEEVTAIPGIREQSPAWYTLPSTLRGVVRPAARSSPASCWEHGQDLTTLLGKDRSGEHMSPPCGSQVIPEGICCSVPVLSPQEGTAPRCHSLHTQHFVGGDLKKGTLGLFLLPANSIPREPKRLLGRNQWHPASSSTGVHGPPLRLQCSFQAAREQG